MVYSRDFPSIFSAFASLMDDSEEEHLAPGISAWVAFGRQEGSHDLLIPALCHPHLLERYGSLQDSPQHSSTGKTARKFQKLCSHTVLFKFWFCIFLVTWASCWPFWAYVSSSADGTNKVSIFQVSDRIWTKDVIQLCQSKHVIPALER